MNGFNTERNGVWNLGFKNIKFWEFIGLGVLEERESDCVSKEENKVKVVLLKKY